MSIVESVGITQQCLATSRQGPSLYLGCQTAPCTVLSTKQCFLVNPGDI